MMEVLRVGAEIYFCQEGQWTVRNLSRMKNVRAGPPRQGVQGPKLSLHSSEIFQPWLPSTRVTKVMADNLVPDFPGKKLYNDI